MAKWFMEFCLETSRQNVEVMHAGSKLSNNEFMTHAVKIIPVVLCFWFATLAGADEISFSRDIRPILSENCFTCHGPDEKAREAGLRLDLEADAKGHGERFAPVVPGKADESTLIERIESTDADVVMPPPKMHKAISPQQVAILKQWINEGAPWGNHWSYESVRRPNVPTVGEPNAIDAFLANRLAIEKHSFSKEAEKATLIRRLALDLTGLPPSLEELESLSTLSHEQIVAQFIDKPAYGEHWGQMWLDLARYADSAGYPSDPGREIWAYRDWVIRALNSNMPFDQFTIEQIAGDLLSSPTDDQLIATAFHRNTMTNNEGGTNDEEFRNAAVIDRVNTTFAVWMGTTMACAQCHTHKYDPITINEYFKLYAFFNQSADADKRDESPLHQFYTSELKEQREQLEIKIAKLESQFDRPPANWLGGLDKWQQEFRRELAWHAEPPTKVMTESGQEASVDADATVTIAERRDIDSQTIELPLSSEKITAIRIETFPSPENGNFVLTGINAQVIPPNDQPAPSARFVRVELPGAGKMLQLAEVQVFSGDKNVALGRPAKQSSTYVDGAASHAVDGNTDGMYAKGSVSHTSGTESDAWWEVELLDDLPIERVLVWNRTDGDVGKRLDGFQVVLLDTKRQTIWKSDSTPAPSADKEFTIGGPVSITFLTALADYEQDGFTAASVLLPKDKSNQGWGVGGQTDQPHSLTLVCKAPVMIPSGSRLSLTLEQKSKHKQHTFGRFRVLTTEDLRVQKVAELPTIVLAAITTPAASRTPDQQKAMTNHYVRSVAKEPKPQRDALAAFKKQLADSKPVTVPIMHDLDAEKRRKTQVQLRGNWQSLGDEVSEDVPAAWHALPEDAPRNRLSLAKWIVNPENPLTARVAVNRMWESIFGVGIVRSSEEFGSQGDAPVHPELLDWLAAEFMESGWDTKHLLTLIFNSRAYRQDSNSTSELNELDPDNRLLARGPRFRPSGEMLRDQALAVSGLLSDKMFGTPVRPQRPNLGLSVAFGGKGGGDWETSKGDDRHRRSIYTEVRRNSPYPSFTTFDAPNREVCTIRRGRSNTPLQAFVTLNDPVFVETHQALARRIMSEGRGATASRIKFAYRVCLAREPDAKDLETLTAMFDKALAFYQTEPELAIKMATDPLVATANDVDLPTLAAWTALASIVMNLDEFLMRR